MNPAMFTMTVKQNHKYSQPFNLDCQECGEPCAEHKFSHFRLVKGKKYAVHYCHICRAEHLAAICDE